MKLLAHIKSENGIRTEQMLKEHCFQTARYAAEVLKICGLENTAYLSGLMHDMGKATMRFNEYLLASFQGEKVNRGSVNHTFAGCIWLLERYHGNAATGIQCLTSEIISCAIGGHHGIFDCVDFDGKSAFRHRLSKDRDGLSYEEAVQNYLQQVVEEKVLDQLFQDSVCEVEKIFQKMKEQYAESIHISFQIGMLVRLMQSAVMYGDRRDTSEFMNPISCRRASVNWEKEAVYLEKQLNRLTTDSPLNQVRKNISEQCKEFAVNPAGIYRLNVPTGGGKTLAALRYALWHAEKNNKRRIIFVIPLLSILDQNAKVIRAHLSDPDLVLEHHSNVVHEREEEEKLDLYETLTDNWGAPIIISTLVQLLDILFSHKTSAITRMQALCNSVIIIDEVQSVPVKTMAMLNMAMNFLSTFCNTTIILSSATQPCLERLKWPLKLAETPDIVRLHAEQLSVFERAEIIDQTDPYGMDLEQCADFCRSCISECSSLLIICNTKTEARNLFVKIQNMEEDWLVFHLSTSMCQEHRSETLKVIQKQLDELQEKRKYNLKTRKVICISTQLVEAGVDFSFECVVRVLAGIDNLAQAAGRCNRSNEYGMQGKVYLVNLKEENLGMLPEISRAQRCTRMVLASQKKLGEKLLIGEQAARKYYSAVMQDAEDESKYPVREWGNGVFMAELLGNKNPFAKREKQFVLRQPFKTVGKKFQVFENDTIDVIVPYQEGRTLIKELELASETDFIFGRLSELMQRAKRYTISIFEYQKKELEKEGCLFHLCEERIYALKECAYDEQYGLIEGMQQSVEQYIF